MAGYYCELEGDRRPSLLLRLRHPRPRTLDVLFSTPGIELLAPASTRAAVEVGYRHPIQLASATSCLPGEEMFLFRGTVGRVERLPGPPRFVDGRHLVEATGATVVRDIGQLREAELAPLRVELQMRPSSLPREPRGALVSWDQVWLLRHLVYLIPPSALAASRVGSARRGSRCADRVDGGREGAGFGGGGRRRSDRSSRHAVGRGCTGGPRSRRARAVAADSASVDASAAGPGSRRPCDFSVPARSRGTAIRFGFGRSSFFRWTRRWSAASICLEASVVSPELAALGPGSIRNDRLGRFALWGFGGLPSFGRDDDNERGPGQ